MYRTKNEIKCCDVAFLYERLSRDDELDGESNSIANQKKLLVKVAKKKGIKKAGGTFGKAHTNPYHWGQATVIKILTKQEYCGDLINFKTYSKSYKNKKRYINDADNMLIFKDVHKPIIDRELFEEIQLKRGKTRKRPMANGEKNMFLGLFVCSDCGSNLNYHLSSRGISSFCCPGFNQGKRKECLSAHYVRMDFLEEAVLAEIRRLTRFAGRHEDLFIKTVSEFSRDTLQSQISAYQSEVRSLTARDRELD